MTTVRELLDRIRKEVENNPAVLDMEVYAVDTSSGAVHEDVSAHVDEISECDLDMSSLGEDDLGTPYLCLSL